MKTEVHLGSTRGSADHGWLKANHTFSFASYHDPKRMHFGKLRVLNDDHIAGGKGFDTHPHDNMEIVTIMLKGALAHKDSMGNEFVINEGEVQRMSAGSGITHSEFNHIQDAETNLLQIWVLPKEKDIKPSYGQKAFPPKGRQNKLQLLVTPNEKEDSLWINQNAYFSRIDLDANSVFEYCLSGKDQGCYVFLIEGEVEAAGKKLGTRDGLGVWDTMDFTIKAQKKSQLLFIEVPV